MVPVNPDLYIIHKLCNIKLPTFGVTSACVCMCVPTYVHHSRITNVFSDRTPSHDNTNVNIGVNAINEHAV